MAAPKDEWDRRFAAVVRVTVDDIARVLDTKFCPAHRKALRTTIEQALFRWMDNEREMYSEETDVEEDEGSPLDKPPAGNA